MGGGGVIPGGFFGPEDNPKDDGFDAGDFGGEDDTNSMRKGSETKPYMEAIAMRKPGGQYRLVRFFDFFPPTAESRKKVYEYRVRVWVGDPNQLDPSEGFAKNRGKRLEQDAEGSVKFGGASSGDGMSGMGDMGGTGGMDGMGGMGGGRSGGKGDDMNETRKEVVVDVKPSMITPRGRKRIKAAISLDEMQERFEKAAEGDEPVEPLYVAEYSKEGELEQIKLPPSKFRYAYTQYLRFARPSAWSEPVRVQGRQSPTDVYAGATVQGRPHKMDAGSGEVEFEKDEPYFELVVSAWSRSLGTKLRAKRNVHVGETLDFNSPTYVTHPITLDILAAQDPNANNSDPDDITKFTLPIRTGQTVVDAFAGQQLDLPSNKKLKIETPTELLTMDPDGNLTVSNQFDAATGYRNEIAEQDISRFYGRGKRNKDRDKGQRKR